MLLSLEIGISMQPKSDGLHAKMNVVMDTHQLDKFDQRWVLVSSG